jgi:hypothetical protein
MERRRIDDLARLAARHASRRAAIKALGGAAVAGAGGVFAIRARDHGDGHSQASALTAATPIALPTAVPPSLALSADETAVGSTIQATLTHFAPGDAVELRLVNASGAEAALVAVTMPSTGAGAVDLTIPSTANAGAHAIVAVKASGESASAALAIDCGPALTTCDDICADLQSDVRACGACGNACDAGEICLDGGCIAHQIPAINGFFDRYNGECLDFDGEYGNQCMDVVEYYNRDVVGAPQIGGDAIDAWSYFSDRFYVQIENGPGDVPEFGDIIVWSTDYGDGAGHVAICHDADMGSFTSFDQNWPTGSCCHFQYHEDYDGVIGWLRPKW